MAHRQDGSVEIKLCVISSIDVDTNSVQSCLDGLFGPTVKHLRLDFGSVGVPSNQNKLGSGTIIRCREFNVHQSIARFIFWKIAAKVFVCLGSLTLLFNHNGFLILNLVDDVSKLLAFSQLEILEGGVDLVGCGDSGGLKKSEITGESYSSSPCTGYNSSL